LPGLALVKFEQRQYPLYQKILDVASLTEVDLPQSLDLPFQWTQKETDVFMFTNFMHSGCHSSCPFLEQSITDYCIKNLYFVVIGIREDGGYASMRYHEIGAMVVDDER
jgi:hypothetical protein